MSYTHHDLQQLIEKWSEYARSLYWAAVSVGDQRAAEAIFWCVDDLIDLTTLSPNELRRTDEL